MSKELILMRDVDGLGITGDTVSVADGFARNFLLPRKLAAPVTALAKRQIEKAQAERLVRLARESDEAKKLATALEGVVLQLTVKAGPEGKLFGSVSNADVAELLAGKGYAIDRHKIHLHKPIRETGDHEVPVKLHPEVSLTLNLKVVAE
jgi:large subunit ribosomal protein L9